MAQREADPDPGGPAARDWRIGDYVVERLAEAGIGHVFGVPGDYCLGLLDRIVESDIEFVGTCNELNAGYAADAYARIHGVGAVAVTYAVGGFSLLNAVAGAYAERVPVVVLCGGPSRSDRKAGLQRHHTLGDYGIQLKVFEAVTELAVALESAEEAPGQIDSAMVACREARRPVFIEIPADLVDARCSPPQPLEWKSSPPSDPAALAEAVSEAALLLTAAERPLILGGVEVHRFGLREELEALIEHAGYPVATALMGKSLINETNPHFIGLYSGALSEEYVRETVEGADCVLNLGAFMSDINLGIYTASIATERLIHATPDHVQIKHHRFDRVFLGDFIRGLRSSLRPAQGLDPRIRPASRALLEPFEVRPEEPLTIRRFYERVNHILDAGNVVLADAGDSFMCAGDLLMHEQTGFISQAFYCSIGFTLPAALGVGLAAPERRPVVFIGDGAFQMVVQELSTLLRHRLNPVIFLMNNRGYTVERVIHDGPYNDIQNWRYHELVNVFCGAGGWGCEVRTEGELEVALGRATREHDRLAFVEVHLDPMDCSPALRRLGEELRRSNALEE
jgi:indolepyruvate decarboxylase